MPRADRSGAGGTATGDCGGGNRDERQDECVWSLPASFGPRLV